MKEKNKRWRCSLSIALAICLTVMPSLSAFAEGTSEEQNQIRINEVESNDANGGNDWVEIINLGTEDVDISGFYITDDKGAERVAEGAAHPLNSGTILKSGQVLVLEETVNFTFGLGKADTATLYDAAGNILDLYSWTAHAVGTYSRTESGEFVDREPTKGAANKAMTPETPDPEIPAIGSLVINEVNSSPDDWVEVMNISDIPLDIAGWEIRDNSDDHRWQFRAGTTVQPGGLLLVKSNSQGLVFDDATDAYVDGIFDEAIGIGSGDSIRLYNKEGQLVDSHNWTEHANVNGDESASWGRYPDGTGSFVLMPETPNEKNSFYAPNVVINEVESDGDTTNWVEIYNTGADDVDISGWYLYDNDPVGHAADITPVADGTILKAGECFVFEENTHFSFGLGKADCAAVYNSDGVEIARYEWSAHAMGVYARIPDGIGEFMDFKTATKGKLNIVVNPVVINEIQSKDPNGNADWIELANPTDQPLDIAGLVLKDNDDTNSYIIPDGTIIPANGFLVLTEDDFGFGLGKGDSVRIFENDMLISSVTWQDHTNPTWGLYPDVNGKEYRSTLKETPGIANEFDGIPKVIAWPGSDEVITSNLTFLEDSSGLDFSNDRLYAVDNGTGKFWVMDVAQDGTLSFAKGFENGKLVNFTTPSAKGPDTEGITVDGDGYVYLASERDNSDKGTNYNVILKADPNAQGSSQNAMQQWNLTEHLPDVAANTGIEAVEWVPSSEISGLLFDMNTNAPFDPAVYPNATADGVFFVALEDNGHAYAFVLNKDDTVVLIADIDSKIGGAMALDYDSYEKKLWIAADDGYGNICAQVVFNGTNEPEITHVAPSNGVDITRNNEGFAIASPKFTVNGQRPVYRFADGVTSGALTIGFLSCSYTGELPHNHSGTKIDGQPATEVKDGWKDYYTCSCGKYFEDAACKTEITDLNAWKIGAGKIAAKGTTTPTEPSEPNDTEKPGDTTKPIERTEAVKTTEAAKMTEVTKTTEVTKPVETNPNTGTAANPQTGGSSNIFLWMALMLVSCGGLLEIAVFRKRRTSK